LVYLPPHFTETRPEILFAHIERHSFGLLVSHGADGPVGSRIPFVAERRSEQLYLQGHLARPNPQVAKLAQGGKVLAIFTGPHAYVSPTWYEGGPAVPTCNYAEVHAYGSVRTIEDESWLRDFLDRLSQPYEAGNPEPWRMADQPANYLAGMLRGVVGFEIEVAQLEGKFKLSQNRPARDRPRIVSALDARGDPDSAAVAALMREREPAPSR
jgi:transcriptional regulator